MRILLVEDDRDLCEAMRYHLEKEGYDVDSCEDGGDALRWLDQQAHNMVILDRMLPGMDGIAILRKLRERSDGVPVLMVTALDGVGERVTGLDAGADDYLVKPFAVDELLARVRSLGRRPASWESVQRLEWGDISLDVQRHLVRKVPKSVSLTKREAQLLEVLLRDPGTVIPRAVLFARVWGPDAPVEEGNLDNYVHFLRKRLKSIGSGLKIKTVRSVGYSLQFEKSDLSSASANQQ